MSHLLRTSRLFAWLFLTGLSVAVITVSGFYLYLRPGLPPVEQLLDIKLQTPLRVLSKDNRLIAEFGEKRRTPITIEQIPTLQLQAFMAAEDSRFYEHFGIDIKGLARAAVQLVSTGEIQSGGSTITMQVAKNFFLSRDRTFIRKFREILLALQIERELPKDRILELYLNKIYLGNRAYGLAAAADVYYDKPVNELSLAQMAMLAGLPKAPSAYNPLADPDRAMARRNWILSRMRDLGYITDDAYGLAITAPITASYHGIDPEVDADYVAEMARAEMVRRFGDNAYSDGYTVILTVDSEKQKAATRALRDGLEAYDHRHGFRGPIGHLDTDTLAAEDPENLILNYPMVADQRPAITLSVNDKAGQATLYARGLGTVVMPFDTMTWARRYKTEDLKGPAPGKPSDVLAPGDVVYVHQQPAATPAEGDIDVAGQGQIQTVALGQIPQVEGALISLDAHTGAIQALSGGYSFSQSKYNRAIQAKRQPGSNFKPFLYLKGLVDGKTAATIYNDAPIVFDDDKLETSWRPENSSGQFYGPTRLREALYTSRNIVSIRLLRDLGISNVLDFLKQLKIPTDNMPNNLSLALGSGLLTPMDMARGIAVIANGGFDVQPYLIDEIRDARGELVYQAPETILCDQACEKDLADEAPGDIEATPGPAIAAVSSDDVTMATADNASKTVDRTHPEPRLMHRLADKRAVYILHSMMKDVIRKGTGRRALVLDRSDLAGKTGTTNDQRDTWFSGFNYQLATTVWVGFDQPTPLGRGEYGASTALPVWIDYMRIALKDTPVSDMPRPNGIVNVRIDPETGLRARPGEDGIFELFREEDAPPPLAPESENQQNGASDDGASRQLF